MPHDDFGWLFFVSGMGTNVPGCVRVTRCGFCAFESMEDEDWAAGNVTYGAAVNVAQGDHSRS
ncbi:hypothetical protein [Streptomyces sp. NPDC003480]